MRFSDLDKELSEANYRCLIANKQRREVLDMMVKAGKAKVLEDGDYEFYVLASPEKLLKEIKGIYFEGEDVDYLDEEEECIVLAPGEKVDWFMKGYA
jgi:hypothetical protein